MELAVSRGASRVALAERSRIDPAELENQDNRIPFANYVALMRAGQQLCHDPAFALHFGESIDASELSVGCLMTGFAETVVEGFALMNRYSRLAIEVDSDGDRYVLARAAEQVWLIDTRRNRNDFPELTESTFARIACTSRRFLGGKTFVKAVHVTHAEPAYRAEYDRIFQVPVVFGSDKNALLTDDWWMTGKPPFSSRPALRILSEHAEALLESLESGKTTRGRVESLLMSILHTGNATMDTIAGKLGLSRQTLFRRLKAEGVTFEQVLDELRHRLALHYLSGKKVSVNETAYLVGFSEPAAFSRAFKRWTGASPRTVRLKDTK
jgi:AraC-like DNA-binding protein